MASIETDKSLYRDEEKEAMSRSKACISLLVQRYDRLTRIRTAWAWWLQALLHERRGRVQHYQERVDELEGEMKGLCSRLDEFMLQTERLRSDKSNVEAEWMERYEVMIHDLKVFDGPVPLSLPIRL